MVKDTFKMSLTVNLFYEGLQFFGNKAKGRISKRVFQENKERQIFRKMISQNLACFVFLKNPF